MAGRTAAGQGFATFSNLEMQHSPKIFCIFLQKVLAKNILNAVLFIQLRKISGIHIKWSYIWIVLKSCIIMMVFVEIVLKIIPGQSAPWSAIAVGVAVYAFSGYLQENQVIMDIFQKMINFIRKKHMA